MLKATDLTTEKYYLFLVLVTSLFEMFFVLKKYKQYNRYETLKCWNSQRRLEVLWLAYYGKEQITNSLDTQQNRTQVASLTSNDKTIEKASAVEVKKDGL